MDFISQLIFGKYVFQLIVLLKPDFGNSSALSLFDQVATGTYRFMSVITNVPSPAKNFCILKM